MKTIDEQITSVADTAAGDISVFLGAGASAAAGLPTMVSFLDNAYGDGFVKNLRQGSVIYFQLFRRM
jgi:NAD-dependent SIR2 family protein deacetylase